MNRGYFNTSEELMASEEWKEIEAALKQHIKFINFIPRAYGIVEIHGESSLFTVKPQELGTQQYEIILVKDAALIPPFIIKCKPI